MADSHSNDPPFPSDAARYADPTAIWTRFVMFVLMAVATAFAARAEQFVSFGDFEIHYNAVAADFIDAQAAHEFGISRAKNRALLNVTVLRKTGADTRAQAEARVTGSVSSTSGKVQNLSLRPIREPGALYYIAEFELERGESNYRFELTVLPEGEQRPLPVHFAQVLLGP